MFGVSVALSAQGPPSPPESRFSDRAVIECIKKGTAGMESKFKSLEDQANALRRANASAAPVVLQRRRLEEEWCAVEASCAAKTAKEHKELMYGEVFGLCLGR
jgi:hypothetical protein